MPAPTPDPIDLWVTLVDDLADGAQDTALLQRYQALLSPEEKQRGQRFHFERDRQRHWVTRALVRTVLSRYAAVAPQDWVFNTNAYGKPGIANTDPQAQRIAFNVSHTTGMVVLAVTSHAVLGVDVEHLRRRAPLDAAQAYFSAQETADLAQLPPEQQSERFFQYWTLKEAYIKAHGKGLSMALDQFSFSFPNTGAVRLFTHAPLDDAPEPWKFWQIRPHANHMVAVCVQRAATPQNSAPPLQLVCRQVVPLGAEKILQPTLVVES